MTARRHSTPRTWPGSSSAIVSSTSTSDEKERVFATHGDIANKSLELWIYGASVTATNEGCTGTKMRVHWGYFYEDSARDDGNGPGSEIWPE